MGVQVVAAAPARRISARRALMLGDTVPVQQLTQATQEYRQQANSTQRNRTVLVSDFQQIIVQLLAEETEQARRIRTLIMSGEKHTFSLTEAKTSVDTVKAIWEPLFPGRELAFADHAPTVRASGASYKQQDLSDGELQALYLIAKVTVEASQVGVIIVDEPEIHLHGALARCLWDSVEREFPETRFLYITHDIPFALSRSNARIGVVRSRDNVQLLPLAANVPDEIAEQILGAISASSGSKRPVYCEGSRGSPDASVFEALFRHSGVEVVPVGSCDAVVGCLRYTSAVVGASLPAGGIVDRDERCLQELEWLAQQGVHVLPVAEIEHLYAKPEVAEIVAREVLKLSDERVVEALAEGLALYVAEKRRLLHVHACRFAVDEIRWEANFPKSAVSPGSDVKAAERNLLSAWSGASAIDPVAILADASARLSTSIEGGADAVLQAFSGKSAVEHLAKKLEVSAKRYREMVVNCLLGKYGDPVERSMRAALGRAFTGSLSPTEAPAAGS